MGWYMYTRANAEQTRIIEVVITNFLPGSVDMTAGEEEIAFQTRSGDQFAFGNNTGMLCLIYQLPDGTSRMSMGESAASRLSQSLLTFRQSRVTQR
jgi:hypothetical protein